MNVSDKLIETRLWTISIPRAIRAALGDYGASQPDAEVCGLLAGSFLDDEKIIEIESFLPIKNISEDTLGLFIIDPTTQLHYMKHVHSLGKHIVGCFHSHPHNVGAPSQIDAKMINEDYSWLIWGGLDRTIRAWYPKDHKDPSQGFEMIKMIVK